MENAFGQYDRARGAVQEHIETLNGMVVSAKADAGLNKDLLQDMTQALTMLKSVENDSRQHLENINTKLVAAFDTFGNSLKNQVASVMKQTDQHTTTAMQQLLGVVQEMGNALSRVRARA